jgi:hypothetical protein
MSDRKVENSLQVLIVMTADHGAQAAAAGFKSIRVIASPGTCWHYPQSKPNSGTLWRSA